MGKPLVNEPVDSPNALHFYTWPAGISRWHHPPRPGLANILTQQGYRPPHQAVPQTKALRGDAARCSMKAFS